MIDLDQRFGFTRWRVGALVLNLVGNALALYAAVRFIRRGTHAGMLAVGLGITVVCLLLLARPDRRPVEREASGDSRDPPEELGR